MTVTLRSLLNPYHGTTWFQQTNLLISSDTISHFSSFLHRICLHSALSYCKRSENYLPELQETNELSFTVVKEWRILIFYKSRFFFQLNDFFELNLFIYHSFRNVYGIFLSYKSCRQHIQFKKKQKMENLGIDPSTSRMQSGRSTIWANSPARKTSVNN